MNTLRGASMRTGVASGTALAVLVCIAGIGDANASSAEGGASRIAETAALRSGHAVQEADNADAGFDLRRSQVQLAGSSFTVEGAGSSAKQMVVKEHEDGVQTMIVANDRRSAETTRYQFSKNLHLVTANSRGLNTGEVMVMDGDKLSGVIDTPWAVDSQGKKLQT